MVASVGTSLLRAHPLSDAQGRRNTSLFCKVFPFPCPQGCYWYCRHVVPETDRWPFRSLPWDPQPCSEMSSWDDVTESPNGPFMKYFSGSLSESIRTYSPLFAPCESGGSLPRALWSCSLRTADLYQAAQASCLLCLGGNSRQTLPAVVLPCILLVSLSWDCLTKRLPLFCSRFPV